MKNIKLTEKKKLAFTLAEIIAVIVILGITAMIVVPPLVRKQIEASERTKLKEIIRVYDYFINKVTTENDLKSDNAIKNWADDDCENTSSYFKTTLFERKNGAVNKCRFRVPNGMWMDISDILFPTIAFSKDDLDNPDNSRTYNMVGGFDNNGTLRVNDLNYERNRGINDYLFAVSKLYNYLTNGKVKKQRILVDEHCSIYNERCDRYDYDENGRIIVKYIDCISKKQAYERYGLTDIPKNYGCTNTKKIIYNSKGQIEYTQDCPYGTCNRYAIKITYNPETGIKEKEELCNDTSGNLCALNMTYNIKKDGENYIAEFNNGTSKAIYDKKGNLLMELDLCDANTGKCGTSTKYTYDKNNNLIKKQKYCDGNGDKCGSYIDYNNNYFDIMTEPTEL